MTFIQRAETLESLLENENKSLLQIDNIDTLIVDNSIHQPQERVFYKFALRLACILSTGTLIRNIPESSILSIPSIHVLSIFAPTILALVITNYHISIITAWGLIAFIITGSLQCPIGNKLTVECSQCGLMNTLTNAQNSCEWMEDGFKVGISGFSNNLSWLVLLAFQIGKAVEITKLGDRVSLFIVRFLGQYVIGIGYAIFFIEFTLGPFIPSNTARGGGIVLPVVAGLIESLGAGRDNVELGSFLVMCGAISNLIASSMFMTATIGNPLISDMAESSFGIQFSFLTWAFGASLPGLIIIFTMPVIFYYIFKPNYNSEQVMLDCNSKLKEMGSITAKEIYLLAILLTSLILWMTTKATQIPEEFTAFTAVFLLIFLNVISWDDILTNQKAWDSFFWLSIMIMIAGQLSSSGLAKDIGKLCSETIISLHVSPEIGAILLGIIYFFSMYLFSSITAHSVVFATVFFEAANHLNSPPFLMTALIAYFSALSACLTNYSTGTQVMYFSFGFLKRKNWFSMGALIALYIVGIYLTFGMLWWKLIGCVSMKSEKLNPLLPLKSDIGRKKSFDHSRKTTNSLFKEIVLESVEKSSEIYNDFKESPESDTLSKISDMKFHLSKNDSEDAKIIEKVNSNQNSSTPTATRSVIARKIFSSSFTNSTESFQPQDNAVKVTDLNEYNSTPIGTRKIIDRQNQLNGSNSPNLSESRRESSGSKGPDSLSLSSSSRAFFDRKNITEKNSAQFINMDSNTTKGDSFSLSSSSRAFFDRKNILSFTEKNSAQFINKEWNTTKGPDSLSLSSSSRTFFGNHDFPKFIESSSKNFTEFIHKESIVESGPESPNLSASIRVRKPITPFTEKNSHQIPQKESIVESGPESPNLSASIRVRKPITPFTEKNSHQIPQKESIVESGPESPNLSASIRVRKPISPFTGKNSHQIPQKESIVANGPESPNLSANGRAFLFRKPISSFSEKNHNESSRGIDSDSTNLSSGSRVGINGVPICTEFLPPPSKVFNGKESSLSEATDSVDYRSVPIVAPEKNDIKQFSSFIEPQSKIFNFELDLDQSHSKTNGPARKSTFFQKFVNFNGKKNENETEAHKDSKICNAKIVKEESEKMANIIRAVNQKASPSNYSVSKHVPARKNTTAIPPP